jgi:glutamyl-Q tRNA(Asp) synthetase
MLRSSYRGRFAPSPTGLLHAGSLVTALASWLDAKAANGVWVIRMEDLDLPRIDPQAATGILQQLALFGMQSDENVLFQSQRTSAYEQALFQLNQAKLLYVCKCSRKKIAQLSNTTHHESEELVYPGLCRPAEDSFCNLQNTVGAIRIKIPPNTVLEEQNLTKEVGDFVLRRSDQIYTYQLAVVVDDHFQNITHVVRGEDLASNTPRQIWLQNQLQFPNPNYLHIPLVKNDLGEKLSKQTKAPIIWPKDTPETLQFLYSASQHLGLQLDQPGPNMLITDWQAQAVNAWREMFKPF